MELLDNASAALRPGGVCGRPEHLLRASQGATRRLPRLVYSTCTLNSIENEEAQLLRS